MLLHALSVSLYNYIGNMIKKLLTLESVHGPLPGYRPAVLDVMDYLKSVSIKRFIFIIISDMPSSIHELGVVKLHHHLRLLFKLYLERLVQKAACKENICVNSFKLHESALKTE